MKFGVPLRPTCNSDVLVVVISRRRRCRQGIGRQHSVGVWTQATCPAPATGLKVVKVDVGLQGRAVASRVQAGNAVGPVFLGTSRKSKQGNSSG
jgi:hypothetical protein